MKFLIILIATTSVVRGYRHARYYESEYKMPQRYPRYGPMHAEQNRYYRDSGRQLPQPYVDHSNYRDHSHYRDQPPSFQEIKSHFSELGPYSENGPSYSERQVFFKKPISSSDQEFLLPYEHQELNYNSFPPQPLDVDIASNIPNQKLQKEEPRQPLSFGGHSNYLKFGNHALGFASIPIKSSTLTNSELQSPSSTTTPTIFTTSSTVYANINHQSNTSAIQTPAAQSVQPTAESNFPLFDASKNKIESNVASMNDETKDMTKPLMITPNGLASEQNPEASALSSKNQVSTLSQQMKKMPFGISLPLTGFGQNAYTTEGTDIRFNQLLEKSKSLYPYGIQQSSTPELLSYMLPPQQISSPMKFTFPIVPTLPISSLSTAASSPFSAIKYMQPSLPKLAYINHDTIQPQTSLSLASAFPLSEFGQNTVQLGQIGQLDSQRQDVLQGMETLRLHLDLDGFGGIGGINYGAQASNSISKPAVFGIAKVGLSLPEASRSIIPSFTKIGFGQQLW